MEAKVISFDQWKANHPPQLVAWQYGMASVVAWQSLWLKVFFRWPSK